MPKIKVYTRPVSLNMAYPTDRNGKRRLSAEGRAYKEEIGWMAKQEFLVPLVGNLEAIYTFGYTTKKWSDLDNLIKLAQDALSKIAFENDTQICKLQAERVLSDRCFVEITIKEINLDSM